MPTKETVVAEVTKLLYGYAKGNPYAVDVIMEEVDKNLLDLMLGRMKEAEIGKKK